MPTSKPIYRDDFSLPSLDDWHIVAGNWLIREQQLVTKVPPLDFQMIISPVRLVEGTIHVRMRLDHASGRIRGRALGVVLRYPGDKGFTLLRFCSARGVHLLEPSADLDVKISDFTLEPGRVHDVEIQLASPTVTVSVDGKLIATTDLIEADALGTVGLSAEGACVVDHMEVKGDWHLVRRDVCQAAGKPKIEMDFLEWQLHHPQPSISYRVPGTVHAYYRNMGDAGFVIKEIQFADSVIQPKTPPDWIAYVRQQPYCIEGGQVGRLEIRCKNLPEPHNLLSQVSTEEGYHVPLVILPEQGDAVRAQVDLNRNCAIQINFFGFSEDLKILYLYVQKNDVLYDARVKPVDIAGVEVNGSDMTERARLGAKTVFRDVVPIEIALAEPLAKGQAVQVVVTMADGQRTGHVLRAFPSKFNIITAVNQPMARKDYLEDLHHHGVTALMGNFDVKKADQMGFDRVVFGQHMLVHALRRRQSIEALWVDEIDKPLRETSASSLVQNLDTAQQSLNALDEPMPMVFFNLVWPTQSAVAGYMTVPDAVTNSYGYFMCPSVDRGFGRVAALHTREYRTARRPFWPYFRDSEIAVPIDRKKKVQLERYPAFQRCLTPSEHRWLTFGCLLQGAKSMSHWGYRALRSSSHYFNKGEQPVLRLGLGAPAYDKVGPYVLEPAVANMLKETWDEHGRVNCELRTLGPLIAKSDVSYLARVTDVDPPIESFGAPIAQAVPAAEAGALICGLDTLIIVVLNHNIRFGEFFNSATGPLSNSQPPRFDPVNVTVEVRIPSCLSPRYIFGVAHDEITEVSPNQKDDRLQFSIPQLNVSKLFVITAEKQVRDECVHRHQEMCTLLGKMADAKPAADPDWLDVDAWKKMRSWILTS